MLLGQRDKITVALAGGLGNYMFQVACGVAYGLKHDKDPIFQLSDAFAAHKLLTSYLSTIFKNLPVIDNLSGPLFKTYRETSFSYSEIPYLPGNVRLQGHFQSYKYFEEYRDEVKQYFNNPRTPLLLELLKTYSNQELCSIHVRRGDYLLHPTKHPLTSEEYYRQAVSLFSKEDTTFLVFSDDIEWCKQFFSLIPGTFIYVEDGTDCDDLTLMSLCSHNILANSTFSWWGAWLNENKNKRVVAPKQWFGEDYKHFNTEDLLPSSWIQLP